MGRENRDSQARRSLLQMPNGRPATSYISVSQELPMLGCSPLDEHHAHAREGACPGPTVVLARFGLN